MNLLIIIVLLTLVTGSSPAVAHNIGISPATLVEYSGNRYILSVQSGATMAHLLGTPVLPEPCRFAGSPRGNQGRNWREFEFVCDTALTASDTLLLPWRRDGTMFTVRWVDGSEAQRLFRRESGHITIVFGELQAGSGSWLDAAARYVSLGIEHILLGIDHLLFILALLLIVRGPWMLVKTITAFTVAHSLTLGLATLGVIHVPSRPVEASIALSIVFLCVEIVHAERGKSGLTCRYPWIIAFGFGLLHGLGFAGALAEIGLPQREIPVALLWFNVGVEIGQLLFVAMVLALARVLRSSPLLMRPWAQAIPVYSIGTIATYWFLQRVITMLPGTWE